MKTNKYIKKFQETQKELCLFESSNPPQDWIRGWHYFILSKLYEDYDWDDSNEFSYEVFSHRGNIDKVLNNKELLKFLEHKKFIQKINNLGTRKKINVQRFDI